jgi:hypothetical protein
MRVPWMFTLKAVRFIPKPLRRTLVFFITVST